MILAGIIIVDCILVLAYFASEHICALLEQRALKQSRIDEILDTRVDVLAKAALASISKRAAMHRSQSRELRTIRLNEGQVKVRMQGNRH